MNREVTVVFLCEVKAVVSTGVMPTVCRPKSVPFNGPTMAVPARPLAEVVKGLGNEPEVA